MLAGLEPELDLRPHKYAKLSWLWVFAIGSFWLFGRQFAVVWEKEGICQIVPTTMSDKGPLFAKITLQVHSHLEGVGLTAAVATGLADEEIACNIIAGLHHDYLLVPWSRRDDAMRVLEDISQNKRD